MSQPTTAVLDIEKIAVEEGFNPRTRFDEDGLAKLEASLRETGIVQPLAVQPAKDGTYTVIAGERRLIAAKRAGIEQVPVLIREGPGARAAALAENLIREDLDPIDTARGLAALAEADNLTTHKEIAEKVEMSVAWVSQHLRLLALPEGVQSQIAAGCVPVEAERDLRKVAKVSPRVAECACELVARGEISGRNLVEHFDDVLVAVAQSPFLGDQTMIAPGAIRLSAVIADPDKQRALAERCAAVRPYEQSEDPVIRLGEAEVDAARAAGCLIEHRVDHGGWESSIDYITDAELAADLAERAVERIEKEVAKRTEQRANSLAKNGGDPAPTPEQAKEARKAERAEAKEKAAEARRFNEELGRNLLKRRGGAGRKQHSLPRAKALAAILLADNDRLAASGLRLVLPQLQEVEVKALKSGASRERVSYADPEQCTEYLAKRVEDARSADEVLELVADALIAATLADERELARSRRVHWSEPTLGKVEKLLAADAKSVRPRRQRRQSS